MNKLREKTKTLILLLLILVSIVLATVIWSGDQISGLFSMFFSEEKSIASNQTELTEFYFGSPERILIHLNGEKILLSEDGPYYAHIWKQIRESLRIFLSTSDKKAIAVSDSVWQEACKENSIFLDYNVTYTTEFFSQIFHSEYKTDGFDFNQIVIRFPKIYSSQYAFLMRNEKSGQIYQFYVTDSSLVLDKNVKVLNQLPKQDGLIFSFEINFDKNADSASAQTQNVLIDSMVLLNQQESKYDVYQAVNPLLNVNGKLDNPLIQSIAALFQVNAQTMSKYVDENGSITFVENYATLKIHSDGLIEYQVTDPTAAPPLKSEGSPAALSAEFIGQILTLTQGHPDLLFQTDIDRGTADHDFIYEFDYRMGSSPISLTVDGKKETAITLEIKDNKLISYRHYLRRYQTLSGPTKLPASIAVIDSALRTNHSSGTIPFIDQMYVGYQDTGINEIVKPCWYVHFRNAQLQMVD